MSILYYSFRGRKAFMGGNSDPKVPESPYFVIFTDLDGTLLDHETYGWQEAMPALTLCKKSRVPVILVSSKTRAEMDLLRRRMSLSAPFVSENGGAIFFPNKTLRRPPEGASLEKGLWRWPLGLPYGQLVKGLREIREELGWNIKGFSDMSAEEISHVTGLDKEASKLAGLRDYDEPFIIPEEQSLDKNALFKAAAKRGLTVSAGGRFYHLHGNNDKGRAMEKILSWYHALQGDLRSIALGDSPNDFPMLKLADYPVLVRSSRDFPKLEQSIPRLSITGEMGPKGWNSAVLGILGGKERKRLADSRMLLGQ